MERGLVPQGRLLGAARLQQVQQRISGCFRALHGARVFARIRSYISACRKQGRNILDEPEEAIVGNPFIPAAPPAGPRDLNSYLGARQGRASLRLIGNWEWAIGNRLVFSCV